MLTEQERNELADYAKANGRNWKSKLCWEWLQGATILRTVRNKLGPNGVYKLTARDLTGSRSAEPEKFSAAV